MLCCQTNFEKHSNLYYVYSYVSSLEKWLYIKENFYGFFCIRNTNFFFSSPQISFIVSKNNTLLLTAPKIKLESFKKMFEFHNGKLRFIILLLLKKS